MSAKRQHKNVSIEAPTHEALVRPHGLFNFLTSLFLHDGLIDSRIPLIAWVQAYIFTSYALTTIHQSAIAYFVPQSNTNPFPLWSSSCRG